MGMNITLERQTLFSPRRNCGKLKGQVILSLYGKRVKVTVGKIASINERVATWHNAYMLHEWFMSNVDDGCGNGAAYGVEHWQLMELKSQIEAALADREMAGTVLPNPSGEYDDTYFDTLRNVHGVLRKLRRGYYQYYEH